MIEQSKYLEASQEAMLFLKQIPKMIFILVYDVTS